MKKQTITQKRASLFREWLLATLGNDERYYCCTLVEGIPDGDDIETVLDDLAGGFYDDYLDEMIELYLRAKKRYAKSGWYVNGQLVFDESEALVQGLKGTGYLPPKRIYKKRSVEGCKVFMF